MSITYGDLVKQVRQRMGSHIGSHNTQYQYLLFDFLEQASRFERTKTMTDDQREFLDFWRKNEEKLSNIQLMSDKIWYELNAKAKAQSHIEDCLKRRGCEPTALVSRISDSIGVEFDNSSGRPKFLTEQSSF